MYVHLLDNKSTLPVKSTPLAAGYDLFASEDGTINTKSTGLIPIGIALRVPPGTYGRIAPRSGLAVKKSLIVGAGVIDEDYTGEIKVVIHNFGDADYEYKRGDRVAQLIIEKIEAPDLIQVDSLIETDRGHNGFGSTGN